jgi:hypothetical protein
MTHRAESSLYRFERGKKIVLRGLGDVLTGDFHDNLAVIYFLKETGGAGKLASIARDFRNSSETRNMAWEALGLIAEDPRFDSAQRLFASAAMAETGRRNRGVPFGEPVHEERMQ